MSESRPRFLESAAMVLDSFETGKLNALGPHHRRPAMELRPEPWGSLRGRTYASSISPASMSMMAKLGLGVMVIAQKPWATTEVEVRDYAQEYQRLNHAAPPPILVTFVAVGETETENQELFERYVVAHARSTLDWYEFDNEDLTRISGYEYSGKLAGNIRRHGRDEFSRFLAELQVWGTPDQVVKRLTDKVRQLNRAGVVAVLSFGGMDAATVARNQELFFREVLPRLRAIDDHQDLPPPPVHGAPVTSSEDANNALR